MNHFENKGGQSSDLWVYPFFFFNVLFLLFPKLAFDSGHYTKLCHMPTREKEIHPPNFLNEYGLTVARFFIAIVNPLFITI